MAPILDVDDPSNRVELPVLDEAAQLAASRVRFMHDHPGELATFYDTVLMTETPDDPFGTQELEWQMDSIWGSKYSAVKKPREGLPRETTISSGIMLELAMLLGVYCLKFTS